METDADRLAMISGLGGVRVFAARGDFLGLFEMAHVGVGEVAVDSEAPMLTARSSDLARAGVTVGTTLTIGEDTYIARSVRKDGLGMAELMLEGP